MKRIAIQPENEKDWKELRVPDITSTDVSALFGISPYKSKLQLWHEKRSGEVIEIKDNERIFWGSTLEPSIACGAAKQQGWKIKGMGQYIRLRDRKIGCSFDYLIYEPEQSLLEIKNVDGLVFWEKWIEKDGQIEAPPHIEMQLQHQMLVSGINKGYIAALVGGNQLKIIEREADQAVHDAILMVCDKFWYDVGKDIEPKPDWDKDSEFIASLHSRFSEKKLVDASDLVTALGREYLLAGEMEKQASQAKKQLKAKILMEIDDASKVRAEDFTITRGKQFRVNKRKEKAS